MTIKSLYEMRRNLQYRNLKNGSEERERMVYAWRLTFARELYMEDKPLEDKVQDFIKLYRTIRVPWKPASHVVPIKLIIQTKTLKDSINWLFYELYRILFHYASQKGNNITNISLRMIRVEGNKLLLKAYLCNKDQTEQYGQELLRS